jgi:hypothetical protein
MTKTTTDSVLPRTTSEPPSCLQCRHGRHSSTTSSPAVTWPRDQDESQASMRTRRRRSLQAKLARPFLRLMTLRSGEPPLCTSLGPELYIRTAKAPHSGHPLPFQSFSIIVGHLKLPFRAAPRLASVLHPLPPFLHLPL